MTFRMLLHIVYFAANRQLFFKAMKEDTWVKYWDGTKSGYVTDDTMYALSKMIRIFGPTAAVLGRDFDHYIVSEHKLSMVQVELLEYSIRNSSGTLKKEDFNPTMSRRANRSSYPDDRQSENSDRGQSSRVWRRRD